MYLKSVLLFLLFVSVIPVYAGEKCPPKIDAFIDSVEVYRSQIYDKDIERCIPGDNSFIIPKNGKHEEGISIDGFVVGIETFWHNDLGNVLKITSKAGGHTTVVKLLKEESGKDNFAEIPGGTFSSSMGYIVVSKEGPEFLQVRVRNNEFLDDCQIVTEETYSLKTGEFVLDGKIVVDKDCS